MNRNINLENMENELVSVLGNYNKWLEVSNMTEGEMLEFSNLGEFEVISGCDQGFTIIVMGIISKGEFKKIGEQFQYATGDLSGFQDAALLMLYIAGKFDKKNEKVPAFQKRNSTYFSDKVKTFIKNSSEFSKM